MAHKFTNKQINLFAEIELFIRHVRNLYELGPHEIRAEGVDANQALEEALGDEYHRVHKCKTWKEKLRA